METPVEYEKQPYDGDVEDATLTDRTLAPQLVSSPPPSDAGSEKTTPVITIAGDEPPPNGGLKAWLQVLGSFFLFFNSWGTVNAFGVFETYYVEDLLKHESASNIAWIGSIQSFFLLLIGVVSGPAYDAGYFRHLLVAGTFCLCFGFMMTSLATQYWQIMLSQGLLVGLGNGMLFVPSVAILPQYFTTRRALANGIAASGSSLGGIIYPIAFRHLQVQIGFPWATRIVAFIVLGTCGISMAVMRVRVLPREKRKLFQWSAFKELPFTLFCIAVFCTFVGLYSMMFYSQSYAIDKGILSEDQAFYLLPILNAASVFGRILPNLAADRVGPLNMLIPASFVSALLAFCWMAVDSAAGMYIIVAFYGFSSGAFVSLPPVAITAFTTDMRTLGARMGMSFGTSAFGLLMGTPVSGAILANTGSWYGLQAFSGSFILATAFLLILTRYAKVGNNLWIKV